MGDRKIAMLFHPYTDLVVIRIEVYYKGDINIPYLTGRLKGLSCLFGSGVK